jgi:hypothetical protein
MGIPRSKSFSRKQTPSRSQKLGFYEFDIDSTIWEVGTYSITLYGNNFPTYQGQFQIVYGAQR